MNTIINKPANIKLHIVGDNNYIEFGNNVVVNYLATIYIGAPDCLCNNCVLTIGDNTIINLIFIRLMDNNSKVIIGKDCLFSTNISIWASDTHSIIDSNNNLLNYADTVQIGDHVWVCANAVILKNSIIPNNSIVSINAVVAGKFDIDGSIIAGNPAKYVKHGINWTNDRPNQYIDKYQYQ